MELFSLLAKLTLDKSEYDKALNEAQHDVNSFDIDTPQLELDTNEFETGVATAKQSGEGFGTTMKEIFDGIKGALVVTGIVGAVTGIVNGIKEAVNLTASTADQIDKGADRLNISKKKYQEWDHALRQSGSSINDLQRGVISFNKYVSSFEPGAVVENAEQAAEGAGGDMAQAFARLKINVKDANGQLKTTEQLIEESLLALAGFEGSDEERGTLVTQLFGRGATSLNNLLNQGTEGVKQLLSEASDLGLIMSDEEISNAVAYGDAVANLQEEIDAIKMAFVQDIIPVLKEGTEWLTNLLSQFNPRLRENSLTETFNDIDRRATTAQLAVDEASVSAKKLIEDLKNMGDYWTLDEEGRMTWDALASKALELFPQLSEYIDTDGKKISGNTREIEKNIDAWSRLEKQRILSSALEEKQTAVAEKLTKAYEKGAEARAKEAEAEGKRVTSIAELNKYLGEDNQLSENTSLAEFQTARANLLNTIDPESNLSLFSEVSKIGSDWATLTGEASNLRTEADKLKDEATKAQDELKDHAKYLSDEMGLTETQVYATRDAVVALQNALSQFSSFGFGGSGIASGIASFLGGLPHSHAIGSAYIPWDNYPALLHRGERIETATEVRNNSNNIDLSNLEDRIINAIRSGMESAHVEAVVSERDVARGTNRYNGREIDAGRFVP